MLLNNLYKIIAFEVSDTGEKIIARILLHDNHEIFHGHFPGNPILPGVCTVHIVRELLEKAEGYSLMLSRASNIKYLGFVSPVNDPEVQFELGIKRNDNGVISCTAVVSNHQVICCSFKGDYIVTPQFSSHIQPKPDRSE